MSAESWWDEPIWSEVEVGSSAALFTTRRDLLSHLVSLKADELQRATVWIGAGMDAGPHALALLKGSDGADEIVAHVVNHFDSGVGSPATEADADANDWRKLLLLSARQMMIIKGFTKGMTNQEIAAETGIAFDTVKSHVAIALKTTGAPDRARLSYLYAKLEEAHRLGLAPSAALQGRSTGLMFAGERNVAKRRRARRLEAQSRDVPTPDAATDHAGSLADDEANGGQRRERPDPESA